MIRNSSSGFSLVELAIGITITSLLLIPAIKYFETSQNQARLAANQQRIGAIQQSLANYVARYGRLPCPSSFIAQPGDINYGREVVPLCAKADGSVYTPDEKATFSATGRLTPKQTPPVNSAIIIGALPVRDLGLPDNMRADIYGHLFTYAVSAAQTSAVSGYGVIDVVDATGHSILPLAPDGASGTALYVLVGHGKDGKGAYMADPGATAKAPAIPCNSAPGLDALNCSFATHPASPFAFRAAPFGSQKGPNWFDDTVVYHTPLNVSTTLGQPAPDNTSERTAASCARQLSDLIKSGQLNDVIRAQVINLVKSGQLNELIGAQFSESLPNGKLHEQLKDLPQTDPGEQIKQLNELQGQMKELMQGMQ